MKSIAYIILASTVVSIPPSMFTFDSQRVSIHGIIDFSVFLGLILYVCLQERFASIYKKRVILVITTLVLIGVSCIDLNNILVHKELNSIGYWFIPPVFSVVAMAMVQKAKPIPFSTVNLVVFASLFTHLIIISIDPAIPLFEFPLIALFLG